MPPRSTDPMAKFSFDRDATGTPGTWCGWCCTTNGVLRTDSKGRPYVVCHYCGSRSFLKSDRAMFAIRFFTGANLRRMMEGLREPRREYEAEMAGGPGVPDLDVAEK